MKFQLPSIAAAALLALPLSQAHKYPIDIDITVTTTTSTETTNPVLSALRENGLDKYADYLETRAPLTLARFSGRPSLTLYAPSNSVEAPAFTNSTLHRRNPYDDEANACALCIDDSTPAPPKRNLHNYDHHHHDDDKTTGFSVHRTFLKDPNYINLGEGEYLKLVSGSSNSSAGVQIRVGGGKVVTSSATPIRFSNGVIYVIEAWFTLPALLSTTLEAEGASTFLAAITKAGLLTKLDTTPKITVFAPLGRLPSNCDVEGQVVFDFLGYTPELVADTTYGSVKVTKKGETFYANGLKIVKSDVLTKNGVVHYVESPAAAVHATRSLSTGGAASAKMVSGKALGALMAGLGLGIWMVV